MKPISLYCASAMAALLLLGVNNCTNASAKSDSSVTNAKVVSDGGQKQNEEEWSEDDFTYSLSNGEVTITGLATGVSKRKNMNIPDEIGGTKVTRIGSEAFQSGGLYGSVKIPANVKLVGDYAFNDNQISSLDLSLNGKLTSIGENAFSGNQLSGELVVPDSLNAISYKAFYKNQLSSITISNDSQLKYIDSVAFYGNNLSGELVIPDSLKVISYDAFNNNQLSSIDISSDSQLEHIGSAAFYNNDLTGDLVLPSTLDSIGSAAFAYNNIKDVHLTAEETSVNDYAFIDNNITNIQIDNIGEIKLGWGIFDGQQAETDVTYSTQIPLKKIQPTITINDDSQTTTVDKFTIEDTLDVTYDNGAFTNFQPNSQFSFKLRPTPDTPETKLNNIVDQLDYTLAQTVNVGGEEATPPPGTGGGNGNNGNGENSNGHGNSGNQNPSHELPTTPGNSSTNPISQPEAEASVKPVSKRHPSYVYNKRTIRLHRNANLTSPVKTYRQTARQHAKTFKIIGTAKSTNGALRYRVKGGFITASKKHVANLYYQSHTKRIRVIADKGINQYKDAKLTKRAGHVKRGKVLRIKKLVKVGNVTRYQLTNGNYITGNKTMVMWR